MAKRRVVPTVTRKARQISPKPKHRYNPADKTERNLIPIRRNAKALEQRVTWLEERNSKFGPRIQRLEEQLREAIEQVDFLTKRQMGATNAEKTDRADQPTDGKHPEADREAEAEEGSGGEFEPDEDRNLDEE